MPSALQLLIVDDDEAICQACHRALSREGFGVTAYTDPHQGLQWALESDCDAILLDIKMPKMDGIQFLETLRAKNSDVPVLMMTGYPSVPHAAAAIRLGASDYITKPFTADEIGRAVRRLTTQRLLDRAATPETDDAAADAHLFYHESWVHAASDGSACVGAVLPGLRAENIRAVRLPQVGQVVYQGLPLAAVTVAEGPPLLVPSPITGIVVAANEQLADEPAVLVSDPCGRGWMACLRTAQFDEETNQCVPRRLVLANADVASADEQAERLMCLGCEVTVVRSRKELKLAAEGCVLLVDAASFAAEGPALVAEVNALAPSWKIVVADAADDLWETAYRKHRIFYYAVAPFADNEIADILDAAFRVPEPRRPRAERGKGTGELLSSISITHGGGQKVCLLAAPGLLRCNEGLAEQIVQKLTETGLSVTTTAGEMNLAPVTFVNKAAAFDRLIVLRIKDGGGLPGALSRGLPADCVPPSTEAAARVCWLSIQPDAVGGLGGLDSRTVAALAGHIVREMHSCGRPLG